MSNKELLPCPFCGGEAKYGTNDGFHYIWCDDCGETIFGFSKKEAFDIWNTRVQYVDSESNSSEKPNSSKVNQSVQVPEVVENGSCKYLPDECCKKSCKEENATCKKNLQLTRSDIEKMVKLDWFQYCANGWRVFINSGQITITKENVYVIYFEDYKIHSAITLEQAQALAKAWLVDLICSALGVEE